MKTDNIFNLAGIKAAILDMDGVLWVGSKALPGVADIFEFLDRHHIGYLLATNNSSRNVNEYVARLATMGVTVPPSSVITSGLVTAEAMAHHYPPGTPIYVIGSESLVHLMAEYGYVVHPQEAKVVVVGLDVTLTYDKLQTAGRCILAGAEFIGTNGDVTLPTAGGIAPGNGSILAALQAMTGKTPRLMGKPETVMFEIAIERLGTAPEQTLMIGDRLDTDIEGAQRAGLRTALVLTGVSTRVEVASGPTMPDGIYDDLPALLLDWQRAIS